jgi:DNA helicase-2/ATP-dependent DNA helicase PcrA
VISHNQRKISKNVFSVREKGNPIRVIRALTDQEEGYRVAGIIAETQLRDHTLYEDYAILYRTNAQSRIFEEALRKRNIPYRIYGGISFYQRKEIRDLLAYFRVIINPADGEAMKRIINYPARGIGDTTLSKLESAALRNECSVWDVITALPAVNPAGLGGAAVARLNSFTELINRFMVMSAELGAFDLARNVAKETGILKDLYNDKSPEGVSKYQNLEEILNAIREFSNLSLEEGRPAGISEYLQEVALLTDQDTGDDKDRNRVTLMTVHSAKGLEFKNVFIVGLEKDLFPSVLAGETISLEAMEEERRLFYVALTRAKQQVYLTYAEERYRWGKPESCRPSPFLGEIDQSFMEDSDRETNRFSRELPFRTSHEKSFQPKEPGSKPVAGGIPVNLTRKIALLKEDSGLNSTGNHEPLRLLPGMMVEHPRFGIGKVLQVEGNSPDEKATVFFQNAGQKQLLLRYARLRIIP